MADWQVADPSLLQALDVTTLSFARFMQTHDAPAWSIVGPKLFASNGRSLPLMGAFIARRGFYASLKCCLAGLVLVADVSVNVFIDAGPVMETMRLAAKCRDFETLYNDCQRPGGLPAPLLSDIIEALKSVKIRTLHLGHDKKVVGLGPPADDPATSFEHNGRRMTVAAYFELMCRDETKPLYRQALPRRKLQYPKLPTINIGSNNRPVLVPAELCVVKTAQPRNNVVTPQMTAEIIKFAAMRPDERMRNIMNGDGISPAVVEVIRNDSNNCAFGFNNISAEPMAVSAALLPQAKILYADNNIVDTKLQGAWNMDRPKQAKFIRAAPQAEKDGGYTFGVLFVSEGPPRNPRYKVIIDEFVKNLKDEGTRCGLTLKEGGPLLTCGPRKIEEILRIFQTNRVRIVLVVMGTDNLYGAIKLAGDPLGLSTQCLKLKTLEKNARGLTTNVLLKVQMKLGGACHGLVSRRVGSAGGGSQFQEPPSSISWILDKPCMLLGIDVSHPEPGSDKPSMAAIVGSVDGRLNQYCAYMSAQASRKEMVSALEEAVTCLLEVFKKRNNGRLPETLVIYRDGVSEGQFDEVLLRELPQIHGALELVGVPAGGIKVSIVVCQKRHQTRLFYEERIGSSVEYINPCPGLLVDARGRENSIASARINEFYLNSHAPIQGTAKPCKYSLIYDEIGFKLSELELLTYWTTYLYARCNRSVSYATPAYYAHWASKRTKDLWAAGATDTVLREISLRWARGDNPSTMFFL